MLYAVTRLHIHGKILHNDIGHRKVLVRSDGKVAKIISFRLASAHDKCPCEDQKISMSFRASVASPVHCGELQYVCEKIDAAPWCA